MNVYENDTGLSCEEIEDNEVFAENPLLMIAIEKLKTIKVFFL